MLNPDGVVCFNAEGAHCRPSRLCRSPARIFKKQNGVQKKGQKQSCCLTGSAIRWSGSTGWEADDCKQNGLAFEAAGPRRLTICLNMGTR